MKLSPFILPLSIIGFLVLLLGGCANISPEIYQGTANGYNVAMQKVSEEQLLLNIVRLRYRDAPFFFETSSVTSQLELSSSVGLSGVFPLSSEGTNVLHGDTGMSFSDRPTISYTPLQGDDFFNRLLDPISFEDIALLTNSGWSMDTVSRAVIQRINGLNNAVGASGPTPSIPPIHEEFREVAKTLFALQKQSAIQMGEHISGDKSESVLHLPDTGDNKEADRLRKQLSLDPSLNVYKVALGGSVIPHSTGDTIEINTRSFLGVLFFLSQGVNVPDKDIESGKVTKTLNKNGETFDWNQPLKDLFRVESSAKAPKNASAVVRYRGNWFYIKDNDLHSKSTFMLISQMFSLRTGNSKGHSPILTIPVGSN